MKKKHQPVQLFDSNNAINPEVLKIFENDAIKNKNVCIISIAGAFRQGKSFLLNFFLRYLNGPNKAFDENWLNQTQDPISGFSWRSGSERETTGILMWSEIFLKKSSNNEDIAVILLDTQGTFDNDTTMTQCTFLFALSVLMSSVQIYNLKNNIDLTHLTNLQLFTGYAKMVQNSNFEKTQKPFQKLFFLVRDWNYPFEYSYGIEGGGEKLKNIFEKHKNSQILEIKENFQEIKCFLLPHPGICVSSGKNFKGQINDIDADFKKYVQILVALVLAPRNLTPKCLNGEKITVGIFSKMIQIFEKYLKNRDFRVIEMHQDITEVWYKSFVNGLIEEYCELMDSCRSKTGAEKIKRDILDIFEKKRKCNVKMHIKYKTLLFEKINELYDTNYKAKVDPNFFQKLANPFRVFSNIWSYVRYVESRKRIIKYIPPRFISMLKLTENKIILNPEILKILSHEYFQNHKICILSIFGNQDYKSLFEKALICNFFKMMKMDEPENFHTNFDEKNTILMWSEIFIVKKDENLEEIAVMILDTPSNSGEEINTILFVLSSLIGSIQIFTVENFDIKFLKELTRLSEIAASFNKSEKKPLQKLIVPVKDTIFCSNAGKKAVNGIFNNDERSEEYYINDFYETIERYSRLDLKRIELIVQTRLGFDDLVPKKLNNKIVRVKDLPQVIEGYCNSGIIESVRKRFEVEKKLQGEKKSENVENKMSINLSKFFCVIVGLLILQMFMENLYNEQ